MMIKNIITILLIFPLLVLLSFSTANAQGGNNFDRPNDDRPRRQDRLRQFLGLTDEQVLQIQLIRKEQAPLLREAGIRQRQARQKLDEVIYADEFVEADVEVYLKQFLEAQAEVTKLRLMNELAVRRVLTPEQLEKFRTFRQNAKDRRERRDNFRKQRQHRQKMRKSKPLP